MILINYWAVLVAGLAGLVLGYLWYGPLFGKTWMSLSGITPAQMEAGKKKSMVKEYLLALIGSLVMAYVLANALTFAAPYLAVAGALGASAALVVGFWSWLGFVAPVTLNLVLWEGKSWKLWALNNGYYLVTLCVMGLIFVMWR